MSRLLWLPICALLGHRWRFRCIALEGFKVSERRRCGTSQGAKLAVSIIVPASGPHSDRIANCEVDARE